MSLLSLRNVGFAWGGPPLLDGIDLEINPGERIGLLGRNGAGKSTLMKIIAGEVEPDHGEVRRVSGLCTARLEQEVPDAHDDNVAAIVAHGYAETALIELPALPESASVAADDWQVEQAVKRVLTRMKLDGAAKFATLSSGMKRRAMLARALVREPGLLLLDEPTNHLDIDSITWLEGFLKNYDGALLFVTHDRVFLQTLATRIIEIDRGRLFDWTCDYSTFLQRKQAALEAEERQNLLFDKKLAQEETWIRQGVKARRTRNEGRVRALNRLREERRQRRERIGNIRMQAAQAERSGKLVIEAKDVSFSYGDRPIVDGLSVLMTRGDKIGVIGPNGSGKTTLLKLLTGELASASGTIRHGTRLHVIYYDQLREQIAEDQSVVENVGEGQDTLLINGKSQHIYGYLQDFLFTPDRARQRAEFLSGGERNRMMLARLFKRPSNVMVLDEPTNDLDAETLELLEELVANYAGTLLIVSHDRAFLNNVVTSTLVFEGEGRVKEYDGGYDDYLRQREPTPAPLAEADDSPRKPIATKDASPAKLSFKERRELELVPQQIEQLELEQSELHTAMSDPAFFKQDPAEIAKLNARLETIHHELTGLYARWDELEKRKSEGVQRV